jgi:peptidyl-prolyl cis-trans isomerase B (cyclophilin B)
MLRRIALPLVVAGLLALAGCGDDGSATATDQGSPSPSGTTTSCSYRQDGQDAAKKVNPPSSDAPAEGTVDVTLETSAGDIPITMGRSATPCAVNSFVSLAQQGYFDKTPCHRLTTQGIFVLQCGDPTGSGMGGPGYEFDDELSGQETYPTGTVAMANAGPNTNGSQFFLVYEDTRLPSSYDVIGQMDDAGASVVKAIAEKGTADGGPDGAPKETVTIDSVTTD